MENDLLDIFEHFGWETQRRKLHEEVEEFTDEILLLEYGEGDIHKVIEELADVEVLLSQFKVAYEIIQDEIDTYKKQKIARTKDKMTDPNYR